MAKEITRLYDAGNFNDLIELYDPEKFRLAGNIDPHITVLVACAFNNMHKYDDAISTFSEIKPYDLDSASKGDYFYGLATGYLGAGDAGKAQRVLEEGLKNELKNGDRKRLAALLADLYRKAGLLHDAYALYQSTVTGKGELPDSETARVYLSMGSIAAGQGDLKTSVTLLTKCLSIADKAKDQNELIQSANMELGKVFYITGDHANAVKAFERGFELGYGPEKTDYWQNRYRLALSYLKAGHDLKAEEVLNEVSEGQDTVLQQRAQIKLNTISLDRQLKRLAIGSDQEMKQINDQSQ